MLLKGFPKTEYSILYYNTAVLRVALGLILLQRSISIYGSAIAGTKVEMLSIIASVLSIALTIGFLTPITAILVGIATLFLAGNLGSQISMISCIYIAIGRGGELISFDRFFRRLFQNYNLLLCKIEYSFPNPSTSRTVALILFAGVSWSAMLFHFNDPLWLNGEVLQFLFTNAYLSDTAQIFEQLQSSRPFLISLILKLVIYIQAFFELFSWFFIDKQYGRWFIAIWGTAFFLSTHTLMNLTYLPVIELFLWISLFNYHDTLSWMKSIRIIYDDKCGMCTNTANTISRLDFYENFELLGFSNFEQTQYQSIGRNQDYLSPDDFWAIEKQTNKIYKNFDAYVLIVSNSIAWPLSPLFYFLKFTKIGDFAWNLIAKRRYQISESCNINYKQLNPDCHKLDCKYKKYNKLQNLLWIIFSLFVTITFNIYAAFSIYKGFRLTGIPKIIAFTLWKVTAQNFVNVFNEKDLNMNQYSLVICRKSKDYLTSQNSLVPFQDLNGGRLPYIANDLIYFTKSLVFQRKTINKDIPYASDLGHNLSLFIAKFDNSITKNKDYEVFLLKRESKSLYGSSFANSWGPSRIAKKWTIKIDEKSANKKHNFLLGPANYLFQQARYDETNNKYCN